MESKDQEKELKRSLILQMIELYHIKDIDFMGEKIGKNNKNSPSYHHIVKVEWGGETTLENGALLSLVSHERLHKLEIYDYDLYCKWNELFKRIKATGFNKEIYTLIKELSLATNKVLSRAGVKGHKNSKR